MFSKPLGFLKLTRELEAELVPMARLLKCKPFEVADRVKKLLAEIEANDAKIALLREKVGL